MKKIKSTTVTLTDSDIASEPSMSRRSMLGRLGLGAGAAAVAVVAGSGAAMAADAEGRGRRCAFRDRDAADTVRRNCGSTDND